MAAAAVVLVLGAGLFLADRFVTSMAEEQAATHVGRELRADSVVSLHGWPVTLRMIVGTIERAELTATDVPLERGGTIDRLDVTLHDIDLSLADLRNPPSGLPPSRDGSFRALLHGDITWALDSVPSVLASLEVVDDAVELQTPIAVLSADLVVQSNRLLFEPNVPLGVVFRGPVQLDISDQPGRPVLEDAEIVDGTLVLTGRFADLTQ